MGIGNRFPHLRHFTGRVASLITLLLCLLAATSCAFLPTENGTAARTGTSNVKTVKIDPASAARLKKVMVPLIQAMDNPVPLEKVRIGMLNSDDINAGNAGEGQFYVTVGLLRKANDEELRGVLAHEIAHEDLGHVTKTQALGTGLQLGSILLDQILPGAGTVAPVIADFGIMRPFSRGEEYQADSHAVRILQKAGYNGRETMEDTLRWLLRVSGPSGGFFTTHPGTEDRIRRLEETPGR